MTPAITPLTEEARSRGREQALAARRRRAAIKAEVRAGRSTLASVLAQRDGDPVLARMRVADLLGAVPGIGAARTERLLDECRIADGRRVGGLGEHQVAALVSRVRRP